MGRRTHRGARGVRLHGSHADRHVDPPREVPPRQLVRARDATRHLGVDRDLRRRADPDGGVVAATADGAGGRPPADASLPDVAPRPGRVASRPVARRGHAPLPRAGACVVVVAVAVDPAHRSRRRCLGVQPRRRGRGPRALGARRPEGSSCRDRVRRVRGPGDGQRAALHRRRRLELGGRGDLSGLHRQQCGDRFDHVVVGPGRTIGGA